MKPVAISKHAQREIDNGAEWYEAQREGLGLEFADRIQEAIVRMQIHPEGYATIFRDARRVQLRQFTNWGLWFQVRPDSCLVIACLSGRRRLVLSKERAGGIVPFPEP